MSTPTHDEESANWTTWLWLGLGALAVVATAFGFLHAGRSFWHLSSIADMSGLLPRA